VSWIAVLRDLRVFVWAHFQSKGGAIRNNDFCPRFPRINETIRLRAKFTTDDSDLSWTLGTSITNSFSFLHLIIIPLSLIIPPSFMGVICISTWKEIFVSESLLRGWMGTSHMITCNWNWPELFTLKWCACEDGLLGYCKAKIWMGNPRLDSLLRNGQWMNCFVLRLREEASCWLLSKTTEYFEDQRGLLRRKTGTSAW